MDTVGIRDLKAQLSYHVRRAERGSRLTITDRGRAIAVLGPAEPAADVEWAWRLVAGGKAGWAGGKPEWSKPRLPSRGRPASAMILEDRR